MEDAYQSEVFWNHAEYRSRGEANVGGHGWKPANVWRIQL